MKIIRGEKDENMCFVESNYGLLLFDTGASSSQLVRSSLTEKLKKLGAQISHGFFGEKNQEIAVVKHLVAGEMEGNDLKVSIDDNIGILGNDVLKQYSFIFDMKNNEVSITDRFISNVPYTIGIRNHIYLKIQIKENEYWALVDTGASCSLLDISIYHKLFTQNGDLKMDNGEDWTGAMSETPVALIDSLKIGSVMFPSHDFALVDFSSFSEGGEYPIVAIIGASTLCLKCFSFNMVDGYLKIE